tara:strand:- start:126 stop:341 length:216 start_codon:yes stop_codon:yes gene_type:complete
MVKLSKGENRRLRNLLGSRPDYDELFFGAQDISPSLDRKLSRRGAFTAKAAETKGKSQFDNLFDYLKGLLK